MSSEYDSYDNNLKINLCYYLSAGELVVVFWWTFLFQIFLQFCFCLDDFTKMSGYFWSLQALMGWIRTLVPSIIHIHEMWLSFQRKELCILASCPPTYLKHLKTNSYLHASRFSRKQGLIIALPNNGWWHQHFFNRKY